MSSYMLQNIFFLMIRTLNIYSLAANFKYVIQRLPWWSNGQNLPLGQGMWVRSLVGELRPSTLQQPGHEPSAWSVWATTRVSPHADTRSAAFFTPYSTINHAHHAVYHISMTDYFITPSVNL